MKTFKILFAAIIFVGFASSAMAQTGVNATQNVNASAAIIADIDISKTSDVNFGVVDLDQTHTIDANDEDICSDFRSKEHQLGSVLITPIIKQGDVLGTVILSSLDKRLGDFETKISEITAKVISKKLGL